MSELLTLREGADRAAVSFPTFRRWIDAGEIAVFRHGRVVRVREGELDAFIASSITPAMNREVR